MANNFKLITDTAVGTSPASIYTCPSSTQTTIIGLSLANIAGSFLTASVQVENNDGDDIYLVKDAPLPSGGTLVVIGGEMKVVLNSSDVLKVTSSDSASIDVALSLLEIT